MGSIAFTRETLFTATHTQNATYLKKISGLKHLIIQQRYSTFPAELFFLELCKHFLTSSAEAQSF